MMKILSRLKHSLSPGTLFVQVQAGNHNICKEELGRAFSSPTRAAVLYGEIDVPIYVALIARSPNLEILSVKNSQSITDASISIVASRCPLIRELDISNCYEISYKSLEMIGNNCPNLIILKRNLLNWLDPSQHTGIIPEEYLRACPQDGDREATSIARFMPKLKYLELRFSKLSITGLISITEGCQDLEVLDLFGCANLTSRALEQASANLKNLKTLIRPNFYIPRSVFHAERYGHWRLYDERFQTNIFQI